MERESEANERWQGDLEADQLERLEGREAEADHPVADDFAQPGAAGPKGRSSRSPAGSNESNESNELNERWESDLEADQLDRLAADEAAEDQPVWER